MVDVAQLAEHWIVVPVVAGSTPVVHPLCLGVIHFVLFKRNQGHIYLGSFFLFAPVVHRK